MGYTTEFKGQFTLDKPLTAEHLALLQSYERDEWPGATIRGYNQWRPTANGDGIEWDQEEKFYDWKEWLQYMIDAILAPRGYTLSGSVEWSGESGSDVGTLVIEDGKAKCRPLQSKPFLDHATDAREVVTEAIESAMSRGHDAEELSAFRAALSTLGAPLENDRVTFDS